MRTRAHGLSRGPARCRLGLALLLLVVLPLLGASCAVERVVFEERSPYQQVLVTQQLKRGEEIRSLRFGSRRGAIQSRVVVGQPETLVVPYVRATMAGLGFVEVPQRILIVGLGGGSIPMFLHQSLPQAEIDVVELDPLVVQVARVWFGVKEDARLRLHVEDGRAFVERVEVPYDLIVLDAYSEHSVPRSLTTQEFLFAVRKALNPSGAVVANVWGSRSNPMYGSMLRTYQVVFDALYVFSVPRRSNRIVVAVPRQFEVSDDHLEARLEEVSEQFGGGLALGELMRRQSPRASTHAFRGEVLVDE